MKELSERLYQYDFLSAEQDDVATAVFAEAVQLQMDRDGRVVVPAEFIGHAGINDKAVFVGMGRKFQIWQPEAFAARREEARKSVGENGVILPRSQGEGKS